MLVHSGSCSLQPRIHITYDFPPKFKFDGRSLCCISFPCHQITTKFCTCHDSCAVMVCAKFCKSYCFQNWTRAKKYISESIQIVMGKIFSDMDPWSIFTLAEGLSIKKSIELVPTTLVEGKRQITSWCSMAVKIQTHCFQRNILGCALHHWPRELTILLGWASQRVRCGGPTAFGTKDCSRFWGVSSSQFKRPPMVQNSLV